MKKFSILSFSILFLGFVTCVSCGYLLSNLIVSSDLFQYASTVSLEKQIVYAISMHSTSSKAELKTQKNTLQAQNGAGYVYEREGCCYLLASIYENINDAELVKNNLKTSGVESEIISIELSSIKIEGNFSAEEKTILTNCLKANLTTFKDLYDIAVSLDTSVFDETKAKLECNQVFSNIVSVKSNFETVFKSQASNQSIKNIQDYLNNIYNYLSNLISENYETQAQTFSSLIKSTYCNILLG